MFSLLMDCTSLSKTDIFFKVEISVLVTGLMFKGLVGLYRRENCESTPGEQEMKNMETNEIITRVMMNIILWLSVKKNDKKDAS